MKPPAPGTTPLCDAESNFLSVSFSVPPNHSDLLASEAAAFDIELSRVRFLAAHVHGGTVLDLGCGSGPYGATLKQHCGVERLVGIDMDPQCVAEARQIYDETQCFQLVHELPFADNTFDTVFSVDFFGHIEFRHKDHLIREVQRVTRPGGLSLHIVESGLLEYDLINVNDPNDARLRYVRMEGHVGIEAPERLRARWERFFEVVALENAMVYPLYSMHPYLVDEGFDPALRAVLGQFDLKERRAAQICLGFASEYFKRIARELDPRLLEPRLNLPPAKCGEEDRLAALARRIFQTPCGLVYLVARKVAEESCPPASRRDALRQ